MSRAGDTKSVAVDALTEIVKNVTVDKLIGGTSALCAMCLGTPITGVTSVAGAVAAMALFGAIKLKKAAKERTKDEEAAEHCQQVAKLLEQIKHGVSAARDQLAEIALQQQWFKDAIKKGPEAFNQVWQREIADCAAAIEGRLAEIKADTAHIKLAQADLKAAVDGLATIAFDSNWRIRKIEENVDKIDQTVTRIEIKLNTHTDLLNQILASVKPHPSREEIEREIRPRLEREIEAKLRREQSSPGVEDLPSQAKRLADIAITALNSKGFVERAAEVGGTLAVLEGLQKQAAQHEAAALHHIEASVAIWSKSAEWAYLTGEIDTAADALRKILSLRPDDLGSMSLLARIMRLRGNLREAQKLCRRVCDLAADESARGALLNNLGLVELDQRKYGTAEMRFKESLAIAEKNNDSKGIASVCANLGVLHHTRGNLASAEQCWRRSLKICEDIGDNDGVDCSCGNLGLLKLESGDIDSAEAYLSRALERSTSTADPQNHASAFASMGLLEMGRRHFEAAIAFFHKALAISEQLGDIQTTIRCHVLLAKIALRLGDWRHSVGHLRTALAAYVRFDDPQKTSLFRGGRWRLLAARLALRLTGMLGLVPPESRGREPAA